MRAGCECRFLPSYPLVLFLALILLNSVGCASLGRSNTGDAKALEAGKSQGTLHQPPSIAELSSSMKGQSPEELQGQLAEYGENWLYGQGFGATLLNIGTVVVFPPYALYLVGNAGLALAGFEPLYVTDLLPDTPREEILSVYGHMASIPGNVAAKIAGREEELTVQD